MKDWKGFCPTHNQEFNFTAPRLGRKECPLCKKPLVPDHVTQEKLDDMIVKSVCFALDGHRWIEE